MLPGIGSILGGLGAAAGSTTTGEYRTTVSSASNLGIYTFTAADIGAADAAREVIVFCGWKNTVGNNRSISSATIGGVTATLHASVGSSSDNGIGILQANVPTGTTGDIVITMSGGCANMVAVVYRVVPASATPLDFGVLLGTTSVVVSNISVGSGGFLMVFCHTMSTVDIDPRYDGGVDTPVADTEGTIEAAHQYLGWSCVTTETVTTNDPGGTQDSGTAEMCVGAISFA